jgi:hypothetical protein
MRSREKNRPGSKSKTSQVKQERMKMKRKNATLTLMITYGSDPNRTGGSSKAIISTIVAICLGGVDLLPPGQYPAFTMLSLSNFQLSAAGKSE